MQVFKAALRIFYRHPIYIVIYVLALSLMAVFIGLSIFQPPESDFTSERPTVAVIDRDDSTLATGITEFLAHHATLVEVKDSRHAIQDAIAQDFASYIIIIPEGFGSNFMSAAQRDATAPALETMVSSASIHASMIEVLLDEYLNTSYLYAFTGTAKTQADVLRFVEADMAKTASAIVLQFGDSAPVSQQWLLFNQFSGYTLLVSTIVCIGLVMAAFKRNEIRRRNLSSPVGTLSMNLQIATACIVVALMVWVWISLLGLAIFGQTLVGVNPAIIGLIIFIMLALSSVPIAIGFLLGQLTSSELAINATGNLTALVLAFLGGVWVPLDFMGSGIAGISRFTPLYYYGEAISKAAGLDVFAGSSLAPILADMGIILLFSATIFIIALVAGRLRIQSAEAGGNAAANRR